VEFTYEELVLIREALVKVRNQSETDAFEAEKRILDGYKTAPNEKAEVIVQMMYDQIFRKIENSIKEMKNE